MQVHDYIGLCFDDVHQNWPKAFLQTRAACSEHCRVHRRDETNEAEWRREGRSRKLLYSGGGPPISTLMMPELPFSPRKG